MPETGDAAGVALITGGGQGIGRSIALRLARDGFDVVLAARSKDQLDRTADELGALGVRALPVVTDLRDADSVEAMAGAAVATFGGVDVLVCNSGVAGPTRELWDVAPDEWEETFRVNVTGTYLTCRACLPHMIERRTGSVVVIGSMSGKRPLFGRTPYTASKMALVGLVRTLAVETGPHGIRVNLVSPGATDGPRIQRVFEGQARARGITVDQARTEMTAPSALGRLTRSSEVADTVAFLGSQAAAGITGEDVNVSAGLVMY